MRSLRLSLALAILTLGPACSCGAPVGTGDGGTVGVGDGDGDTVVGDGDGDGDVVGDGDGDVVGDGDGDGDGSPVVTITGPADGAYFGQDQTITFTGFATDQLGAAIPNGDLLWYSGPVQFGAGGTVSTVLPLGNHDITLTATDSGGAVGSESITIHVVDNVPPQCTINNPDPGDQIDEGDTVSFSVSCQNPDGSPVQNADISWESSLQGPLGAGQSVQTALVELGTHVISVCAADPEDNTIVGCATVTVEVVEVDNPPVVTITSPNDGDTFDEGAGAVTLNGTANDAEDGALVGDWTSSVLGDLGSGNSASLPAVPGVHEITFEATDSAGATRDDQITVTITPAGGTLVETSNTVNARVNDVVVLADGTVLAAAEDGLYIIDPTTGEPTASFDTGSSDIPNNNVRSISVDANGDLAVSTSSGAAFGCDPTTFACDNVITGDQLDGDLVNLDGTVARDALMLPDGRFLVAGDTCLGFIDLNQGEQTQFCNNQGGGQGLNGEEVLALALHPITGEVWLITNDGVSRMDPAPVGDTADRDASTFNNVNIGGNLDPRHIAIAPGGDVWLGGEGGVVLWSYPDGDTERFRDDDGLPGDNVRGIAIDVVEIGGVSREVAWVATNGGLGRIDATIPSVTAITTADGLNSNDCRSVAVTPDHTKVVGHDPGISLWFGY